MTDKSTQNQEAILISPRNEECNQQIRDERREQILHAALKIFANMGLAAAKVSDIMAEAGLSHGLFYHYFESKERVFIELATVAFQTSSRAIMDAARLPGKSPWERLVAMTEGIVPGAYLGIGPYYFLLVNQAFTSISVPEEVRKLATEQTTWYTEYMVPLIVEGQQKGEIAAGDPFELAMAYFSLLQGIAVNKVQGGAAFPIPSAEIILRIFK